jgi:hypothetical protein
MNGTTGDVAERQRAVMPAEELLIELLAAWSQAHDVVLADQSEACEIIWGTLHGMAALGYPVASASWMQATCSPKTDAGPGKVIVCSCGARSLPPTATR